MHLRETAQKILNCNGRIQHLETALPKPGFRGSSPLRDANKIKGLIYKSTPKTFKKSAWGNVRVADLMSCSPHLLASARIDSAVMWSPIAPVRQSESWSHVPNVC
jgi:hypothetical protein